MMMIVATIMKYLSPSAYMFYLGWIMAHYARDSPWHVALGFGDYFYGSHVGKKGANVMKGNFSSTVMVHYARDSPSHVVLGFGDYFYAFPMLERKAQML